MENEKALLKTKQDVEEFLQWIAALKSGTYEQGKQALQSVHGGYCCLGVACIVLGKNLSYRYTDKEDTVKRLAGGLPFNQRDAGATIPDWLCNIDTDFLKFDYRGKGLSAIAIANMNDSGMSFTEIADVLMLYYQPEIDAVMGQSNP